jgi:hypothetical protein
MMAPWEKASMARSHHPLGATTVVVAPTLRPIVVVDVMTTGHTIGARGPRGSARRIAVTGILRIARD